MDFNPSMLPKDPITGRPLHQFTFDLETQGLRTRSYTAGSFKGRSPDEPLGISSISYGRMGKKAHLNAFTDLVTRDLLHEHGVTEAVLETGEIPASLLSKISRSEGDRYDPTKPPRWDPSIRERGSVLDQVFRRHAKHALKGHAVLPQADVYQKLVNEWSGISATGGIVELGAWNVGYDMPTLFREMRRHGLGSPLDDLLKSNSIRVREMAESLHAARFESMLRSNWTPVMTDRSIFKAAIAENLTSLEPADVRRLGGTQPHTSLRDFMDDVKGGREAFKARSTSWLSANTAGNAQAQASVERLVDRLSEVHDWTSFKKFAEYGHRNATQVVAGERTLYDVLGQMYDKGGHTHILGDLATLHSTMRYAPMAGMQSAFGFVGGSQLGEVAQSLVSNQKQLEMSAGVATEIQDLLGQTHQESADRRLMEVTSQEVDRIRRSDDLFKRWMTIDQEHQRISTERRMGSLFQDHLKNSPGNVHASAADEVIDALRGGGQKMKTSYAKGASPWLWVGLGAAAAYTIQKHNEVEEPPKVQGLRRPKSDWDTIEGIIPSELPFSNISAFGSGYDPYYGMLTASQLTSGRGFPYKNRFRWQPPEDDHFATEGSRIHSIVEDEMSRGGLGDPEQTFYALGGKGTIDFVLPGGTPVEIKTTSKLPRAVKPQHMGQIQFDLFATGKPFGYVMYVDRSNIAQRRLFRVQYDAEQLSAALAHFGRAVQFDHAVESQHVGHYLKTRLGIATGEVMQWVKGLFASDEVPQDPFMWTALGNVATTTNEDDYEDDSSREEQVGYGGLAARRFHGTGHAGYVQHLSQNTMNSRIRDQATQLRGLPGMPRTRRGRQSNMVNGHSERAAMMDMV